MSQTGLRQIYIRFRGQLPYLTPSYSLSRFQIDILAAQFRTALNFDVHRYPRVEPANL
jgi:hypothetical protein